MAEKRLADSHQDNIQYPTEELEWIAATSFNNAVSCYCVKDDTNCQYWAEKAMTVAAFMDDGGVLAEEMRKKYSQLRWDGQ